MKRIICLTLMCLFLCPMAFAVYPVDIQVSDDKQTLRKVYEFEIGAEVDISKDTFQLNGYTYSFVDFIVEEVKSEETYWAIEPIEFYSKTNDVNSIINQLEKEIDVNLEDGFRGRLPLNLSSISVKSLGTGKSTKNVSTTQTYPNLSDADMTHIPKSLDGMALSNVQWQTDNTQTIDHHQLTDRYSCVATYSGTSTSTYSKGYTVTADYQGELKRETINKVRWTAVYTASNPINYWWFAGLIPFAIAPLFLLRKRGKQV